MYEEGAKRAPISEAHARLGAALRHARKTAGRTMREMAGFSSGHISNVENGRVGPSIEVVEAYVVQCGAARGPLVALLHEVQLDAERRKASHRRRQRQEHGEAPKRRGHDRGYRSIPDIMSQYVNEVDDASYIFDGKGNLIQLTQTYGIRALVPGVRLYYVSHGYTSEKRRGVLSVEAGDGCAIEEVKESDMGSLTIFLWLDKEVNPGANEPYYFSYRISVNATNPIEPLIINQYGSRSIRSTVRLQFTPPALPARVWWVLESSELLAQMEPAEDHTLTELTPGYFFKDFYQPPLDWWGGIGWRWPY